MSCEESTNPLHPIISQTIVDTKKFYCPFLQRRFCRRETSCTFSHDRLQSIRIPDNYCHFYLANECLYGPNCKFIHAEPEPSDRVETPDVETEQDIPTNDDVYGSDRAEHDEGSSSSSFPSSRIRRCRMKNAASGETEESRKDLPLCPYSSTSGECPFPEDECSYLHGLDCDLCGRFCLHPYDLEQQRRHRDDCLREHECEMELSFAIQRSKDKCCGICMDTVVDKQSVTASRFGILEKCNHIFCLDCIRKWRRSKQFENQTIRACPECRVNSDFVVPSKYWVEEQEDKEKLILSYKAALRSKPCKYFAEGKGECPFAGSCFYKHAYPDGRLAELGAPKPKRKNRRAHANRVFEDFIYWTMYIAANVDDNWSNEDDLESLFMEQLEGFTDDEFDGEGYYNGIS